MTISNHGILNPIPSSPSGYLTKDETWAAVPWGNQFIIIHQGLQVHTAKTYSAAKSYIQKQVKSKTKTVGTLESFL
jgi:hypothetical protein